MNDEIDITPLIDTGYVQKVIQEGQNAVFKNGRLVYIILDVDKPGKFFFDLRTVFNASTGEGGKDLKIMFMNNAVPWQLNGKTVSIDGAYPSGERFHVTGSENQANSSLIDFTFPLGLFQEAGVYQFQFEIRDESGNLATSHYCFFQVTQNATLLAADFKNGVNPFDSDYTEWKNKVEQEVNALTDKLNNLNTSADQLEQLMNNYIVKAQQYVDAAWQKKLDGENTWTGRQHFNGGITFGNNAQGDNLVVNTIGTSDLTAMGTVTLPNTTSFGDFKANQILNAVLVPGFSGMLMNATKNANDQGQWNKNWWLWASKVNIGVGVDYPCYIMHFDLNLDTSDVGKPIATFNNSVFAVSNNAGSTQAVYMNGAGGTMTYHVDSTGVLYLDSVTGISGKGRVRFTGLF